MIDKKKVVKQNLNLPPHEIKKELKKLDPQVTNEEVEKLILEVFEEIKHINANRVKQNNINKVIKHDEEDIER